MANKTLPVYRTVPTTDHDQNVKIQKKDVLCYSEKQLKKLYPNGEYTVVGETRVSKKKAAIAKLQLSGENVDVSAHKSHNALLTKCVGYARVGSNEFVALLRSRVPFLVVLLGCIAALAIAGAVLASTISAPPPGPVVIAPDHPMPSQDVNSQRNEDDDTQKAEVEAGGGSLSMTYSLDAKLDLDTGKIQIYFKNPNASTHDVSIILYVVSGETEVAIAQSGRVSAGYSLTQLEMAEGTATLTEGVYNGYYLLSLFDPETGERALVQPEITGVELVVTRSTADE